MKPKPHPDQRPATGWIYGVIKPLANRPGLYQRLFTSGPCWAFWTGKHWCYAYVDRARALRDKRKSSMQDTKPWRGCLNPPTIGTPATKKG